MMAFETYIFRKSLTTYMFLILPSITSYQGSQCSLQIVCNLSRLVEVGQHSKLK